MVRVIDLVLVLRHSVENHYRWGKICEDKSFFLQGQAQFTEVCKETVNSMPTARKVKVFFLWFFGRFAETVFLLATVMRYDVLHLGGRFSKVLPWMLGEKSKVANLVFPDEWQPSVARPVI